MLDILMLIKTSELEFDDRLKKETISLTNLNKSVEIRAILQNNISAKGRIYSGNKFKTYRLITRDLLPHRKFLAIKVLEMYFHFVLSIIKLCPKIIWLHNFEMIGLFPVLGFFKRINIVKKIIWDQHELPPEKYLKSPALIKELQKAYNLSDVTISANDARMKLLKSLYKINNGKVIFNLPDSSFIYSERSELDIKYSDWCRNRRYFITTGLLEESQRYIANISEAILQFEEFCLIVMGPFSQDTITLIENRTRKKISDKILFTGMIDQKAIINLTDNAFASIVFYNVEKLNNKYCAPNRLYQAMVRGVPLITGNNPPLADFVNELNVGSVLESDGRFVDHIISSLVDMKENRTKYVSNIAKIKYQYNWEANNSTIKEIIGE